MRGYDGKTTKTNMTDEFSFGFNIIEDPNSELDIATKSLYDSLGKISFIDEESQLVTHIQRYFLDCYHMNKKLVWE